MFKKVTITIAILMSSIFFVNAQNKINFGIQGGAFYGNLDINTTGVDVSTILTLLGENENALDVLDGGGLFIGFLADFKLIEAFSIQPELFYANAGGESILVMPLMLKYYVANALNVQLGPQFDMVLDIPEVAKELVDALGFSAAVGLGFDLNNKFALQTKYTLGISNRLDKEVVDFLGAIKPSMRTNTLQLGLVYKF